MTHRATTLPRTAPERGHRSPGFPCRSDECTPPWLSTTARRYPRSPSATNSHTLNTSVDFVVLALALRLRSGRSTLPINPICDSNNYARDDNEAKLHYNSHLTSLRLGTNSAKNTDKDYTGFIKLHI